MAIATAAGDARKCSELCLPDARAVRRFIRAQTMLFRLRDQSVDAWVLSRRDHAGRLDPDRLIKPVFLLLAGGPDSFPTSFPHCFRYMATQIRKSGIRLIRRQGAG
ncbi:hypothetical protein FSB08_32020 [Paraburkholderia sp. JPY432]|uniref:hypothetical protein n=1 Tax=Paraburkholderia youngii TaxID=2782701 RepID=UPI00159611EE|nr:hypothetical protein [Paraburkholderia youngii]NVH77019.1 hypothetical protein [Paraburkholderia youngii]